MDHVPMKKEGVTMLIPVFVDLKILIDCGQLPEVINVGGSAIVVASQVDDLFAMMPV